jgi:hypothetical protein
MSALVLSILNVVHTSHRSWLQCFSDGRDSFVLLEKNYSDLRTFLRISCSKCQEATRWNNYWMPDICSHFDNKRTPFPSRAVPHPSIHSRTKTYVEDKNSVASKSHALIDRKHQLRQVNRAKRMDSSRPSSILILYQSRIKEIATVLFLFHHIAHSFRIHARGTLDFLFPASREL